MFVNGLACSISSYPLMILYRISRPILACSPLLLDLYFQKTQPPWSQLIGDLSIVAMAQTVNELLAKNPNMLFFRSLIRIAGILK